MTVERSAGALVTGASGFIGTRLVRRLASEGRRVTALDILPPRETLPGVDYRTIDVAEPLDPALGAGVSEIYNLAAVHRTPGHPPEEYYRTNILGALNVTRLAEEAGVGAILFTSSISVYGPQETFVTESSPLLPVSDYGRSKRMAEVIHSQWRERDPSRRLVTVRPGVVFGPGERGNYTFLARALKRRMFVYPGRTDAIKSGGYVDELLDTFAFTLGRLEPEIRYNFAFPTPSTTKDIVDTFGAVAGLPGALGTAPLPLLLSASTVCEGAAKVGVKTPIHRERVRKLVNSTAVTPRWLLDNGYVFHRDLASSLTSWKAETDGRFD
ncbi:N/A [soil metagenome]